MRLTIGWLYPTRMNIYGDRGNVIAMQRRAEWRGLETDVRHIELGDPVPEEIDLFFFGGGQDQEQIAVARDLAGRKGDALKAAVESGAALLSVCGGYQLLGREYRPHDAEPLPGIGLFDVETVAGSERFIGNVIVDTQWGELVGFENHSGLTFLKGDARPMGTVRVGRGNNGVDESEGVLYRNAIGCYLHGSLLPKNPVLTDWLIGAALERRGFQLPLLELDDQFEREAKISAMDRAVKTR
ncbi:MAG: glutamine amidotransferase [Thermomicrobiales bacterium]|nr:glutamine amidotransferase [Thermomicrobiales bacterium]